MLAIREALKTALGASFSVTHLGNPVTVNVVDANREDSATLIPAVAIVSQFGGSDPANIGGGASRNMTYCDISILTKDTDTIQGLQLLDDIHSKVEQLVRAVEKTLGTAYFADVSAFRDIPPRFVGAMNVYERVVTVRARNFESF